MLNCKRKKLRCQFSEARSALNDFTGLLFHASWISALLHSSLKESGMSNLCRKRHEWPLLLTSHFTLKTPSPTCAGSKGGTSSAATRHCLDELDRLNNIPRDWTHEQAVRLASVALSVLRQIQTEVFLANKWISSVSCTAAKGSFAWISSVESSIMTY